MNRTKLFGTDGIRGRANVYPMTIDVCRKVARAIHRGFLAEKNGGDGRPYTIAIARDPRISGKIFDNALTAEFCAMGYIVYNMEEISTPCLAHTTKSNDKIDLGIMISASHNPYYDNGIKLFNSNGEKFTREEEQQIEEYIANDDGEDFYVTDDKIWKSSNKRGDTIDAYWADLDTYFDNLFNKLSKGRKSNLKIVSDEANGSCSEMCTYFLEDYNFKLIRTNCDCGDTNINDKCGTTYPKSLKRKVILKEADFGMAFDGDGDRVILCDEKGNILDGDDILAILSLEGEHKAVVSTVMANLGLEKYLNSRGIELIRTDVGDRNVWERMKRDGIHLGGEPAGHIIVSDWLASGDGFFVALKVLEIMLKQGKKLSEMHLFEHLPSVSKNVKVTDKSVLDRPYIQQRIKDLQKQSDIRLVVRASGTEPVIRILVEGEDQEKIQQIADEVSELIEKC